MKIARSCLLLVIMGMYGCSSEPGKQEGVVTIPEVPDVPPETVHTYSIQELEWDDNDLEIGQGEKPAVLLGVKTCVDENLVVVDSELCSLPETDSDDYPEKIHQSPAGNIVVVNGNGDTYTETFDLGSTVVKEGSETLECGTTKNKAYDVSLKACTVRDSLELVYNITDSSIPFFLKNGETSDFYVDWGDGSTEEHVTTASASHTYASSGPYNVKITGIMTSFNSADGNWCKDEDDLSEKCFLSSIVSLGDTDLTDASRMFKGESKLVFSSIPSWNSSGVVSMQSMFGGTRSVTTVDLSNWDVSSVTDISKMFEGSTSLETINLTGWDVSKVTTMNSMFYGASALQDIDVMFWDTSSLVDMRNMFRETSSLTIARLSYWDVSKVTDMRNLFEGATSLAEVGIHFWELGDPLPLRSNIFYNTPPGKEVGCNNTSLESAFEITCTP